jgi:predicted DsbA family dithiol-disulfide isomerase
VFFTLGLNIANHETLINIIKKLASNIDQAKEILATNSYEQAVQLDLKEAYDLGITSVPTFVIDRKYGISGA